MSLVLDLQRCLARRNPSYGTVRGAAAPHSKQAQVEMAMTRRFLLLAMITCLSPLGFSEERIGDQEWIHQLHRFLKVMNEFLGALDDNRIDLSKWKQVCEEWRPLDIGQHRP